MTFGLILLAFLAGFGRVDLEPPQGLTLSGYFSERPCAGVRDPVEANCVAFSDGERTALVYSVDLVEIRGLCDAYREKIAAETGVDASCVYIACTHTHTAPAVGPADASYEIGFDGSAVYDAKVGEKLVAAGKAAIADLSEASIACGAGKCGGISFIRRFRMKDGSMRTNPSASEIPNVASPAGTPDDSVKVIKMERPGKKSLALVNFQCHPDVIGGCLASADWPGFCRRGVEARLSGVDCVFFNGAQGDTNHRDISKVGKEGMRGYELSRMMGERLADVVTNVWPKCVKCEPGRVTGSILPVEVAVRKPSPAECAATNGMDKVARNRIRVLKNVPPTLIVPVSTVTIGRSIAFAGLPCEPFTQIGREVKENSPYGMTFFTCLSNGSFGYLPTSDCFDEGSYETDSTIFVPGASDILKRAILRHLYEIYPAKPSEVPELMKGGVTRDAWEKARRPEIDRMFREKMYGFRPVERPSDLAFTETAPAETVYGGKAIRKRIRATYSGPGGSSSFDFSVWIPTGRAKAPVFVHSSPRPAESADDPNGPRPVYLLPAEMIARRGYAAIAYCNQQVANDWHNGPAVPTSGVFKAFGPHDLDKRGRSEWGILSAWAWGMSRILDWIETEPLLDAKRVAAVGLSRNGKTALVAGCFDKRFALTISCCSGEGGAKLKHIDLPKSEHINQIWIASRWFAPAYGDYSHRDTEVPFDQHQFLALAAPRLLYVSSALEDSWAGQRGEFAAASLASPAWELYGKKGLVAPNGFPATDTPLHAGSVGYHIRTGPHAILAYDWNRYMDFADRHGWNKQ